MDRLYVNRADRTLLPVTATPSWLRPAKYLDPYTQTPAFTVAFASKGVRTDPCGADPEWPCDTETTPGAKPLHIAGTTDGSFVAVRHVDFGGGGGGGGGTSGGTRGGATAVQLRVATSYNDVSIEIRASSSPSLPQSPSPASTVLLAKCILPNTNRAWFTSECAIPHPNTTAGVQTNLIFVFRCANCRQGSGADDVARFNFWQFIGGKASGTPPPSVSVDVRIRARGGAGGRRYLVAEHAGDLLKAAAVSPNAPGTELKLVDREDGSR